MASVEELELSGVRSFDPNPANRVAIQFSKPLTVILGKNGAGKTTIIESLLNATTGKFPPGCGTDKASFIYDPKVVGEHSVKAQIRLKFTGRDGHPGRVIRSYQVDAAGTRKGSDKPKFFALETVISQLDAKTGFYIHANFNAGEADARLRDVLGVSTAVLEHVIFCHQEDCNWPLGSASEVKTNFDAIFAATRYVAALEALRENQKKYSRELKEFERTMIELREHRAQACELRDAISKKEEEVRIIEMRSKGIEPQIQQLRAVAASFDAVKQRTEALSLESAQIEGRIHEKAAAVKRMNLPPSKQSLEELVEIRRNFDAHMSKLETDVQSKEAKLQVAEAARQQREIEVADCRARLMELQRDAAQHKALCAQIQEIVSSVTDEFVIGEAQLDERAVQRVRETVQKLATVAAGELSAMQERHKAQLSALSQTVDNTLRAMDADSKERELKEHQVATLKESSANLLSELKTYTVHADDLRVTEDAVQDLESRLAAAVKLREQGSSHQQELRLRAEVDAANEKLSAVRVEMAERKRHCAAEAQLPFLRSRLAERQSWLQRQLDDLIIPRLRDAGRQPKSGTLAAASVAVEQLREQKREATRHVEQEQLQLEREVAALSNLLEQRNRDLSVLEQDLNRRRSQYVSVVGDSLPESHFSEKLRAAEEEQMKHCRHVSSIESMAKCYEGFVAAAKSDHLCVVCKRSLTDAALADFVTLNEDRQRTTPQQLERAKREQQRSQDLYKELKQVEPTVAEMQRLSAAISDLKNAVRQVSQDVKVKRALLADCVTKRKDLERQLSEAETLYHECAAANNAVTEMSRLEREIDGITSQLSSKGGVAAVPMEELERQYDAMMHTQQSLSEQIHELQRRNAGGGDEFAIQESLTALRGKLLTQRAALARRADLERMRSAIEQEREEHKSRLAAIAARRVELQQVVDKQRVELEKQTSASAALEAGARKQASDAEQKLRTLDTLLPSVLQNIRTQAAAKVSSARDTLRVAEAAAQQATADIGTLRSEIPKIRGIIGDQHRQFTNINEHIRCLELQRSLEEDRAALGRVEQEVNELKNSRLSGVEDLLGTQAASEPLHKIRDLVGRRIGELDRVRALHDGNMEAMQRELSELRQRLASEKFHNVDDRYSSVYIKLQTVELAASDIEKYYKALDKAVQSYHQDKIQQVNTIIAELWRSIYRGSDIDTIELKSEVDGVSATAAGSSKRNYNYRVVMKRGTNEIDMRAKCSAGQKVLASVVIRVALSEAFSSDCGVLALDEPTTNLDEDNARSLAEALRDLIETRKSYKNFQLIVITHDEQFVRALGSQSTVDRFYFVHKDREGAFSRVELKSFDQLFA